MRKTRKTQPSKVRYSNEFKAGARVGYENGHEAGHETGYWEGHEAGYQEGIAWARGFEAGRVRERIDPNSPTE